MGLALINSLHMPVPVNFILVGFSSDGNMGVNVSATEMVEWLRHLDHVLPHTRIRLSELSCSEDGEFLKMRQQCGYGRSAAALKSLCIES